MKTESNESHKLVDRRPKVAEEWDYERNAPFKPEQFTFASHESVWWRCSKNPEHRWFACIKNRSYGEKCPWCFGNKPYHGKFVWIPYN